MHQTWILPIKDFISNRYGVMPSCAIGTTAFGVLIKFVQANIRQFVLRSCLPCFVMSRESTPTTRSWSMKRQKYSGNFVPLPPCSPLRKFACTSSISFDSLNNSTHWHFPWISPPITTPKSTRISWERVWQSMPSDENRSHWKVILTNDSLSFILVNSILA